MFSFQLLLSLPLLFLFFSYCLTAFTDMSRKYLQTLFSQRPAVRFDGKWFHSKRGIVNPAKFVDMLQVVAC